MDDVAAVDAALRMREAKQFLPEPVSRATITAILAAAHRAVTSREDSPWRIHALAGAPLNRFLDALEQAGLQFTGAGGTAALVFSANHRLDRGDWLEFGMFMQAALAAARARGVESCCRADLAEFHEVIEGTLGFAPNEVVVFAAKLGYTAAGPRVVGPLESGPDIATYSGFD